MAVDREAPEAVGADHLGDSLLEGHRHDELAASADSFDLSEDLGYVGQVFEHLDEGDEIEAA